MRACEGAHVRAYATASRGGHGVHTAATAAASSHKTSTRRPRSPRPPVTFLDELKASRRLHRDSSRCSAVSECSSRGFIEDLSTRSQKKNAQKLSCCDHWATQVTLPRLSKPPKARRHVRGILELFCRIKKASIKKRTLLIREANWTVSREINKYIAALEEKESVPSPPARMGNHTRLSCCRWCVMQ